MTKLDRALDLLELWWDTGASNTKLYELAMQLLSEAETQTIVGVHKCRDQQQKKYLH
jgi:hypothetical protein